jgi:ubiquilin
MALTIHFKVSGSGAATFALEVEPSMTVEEVKCLAMEPSGLEPEHMKVIFKGRILKDIDTMESIHVTSGCTMHIVKSKPSTGVVQPTATSAAVPAAAVVPVPENTLAPPVATPTPDLGGLMADPAMMQMMGQMMGGMGGGAPGAGASPMGGMEGMMRDPQFMMQMMQNPMVQQMMQNISQNPQMLQAMIQNNPMLQQMTQNNPMLQQVFNNPQLLQTMLNPQMMQGMLQMQQAMPGIGSPGVLQTSALMGGPNAAPGAPEAGAPGAPAIANPMQQMMQMMQGMQGAGGMPGLPNPADGRSPEERYAVQIQQLEGMGFPDKHSNLQALSQTNGNVNEAINALLGA